MATTTALREFEDFAIDQTGTEDIYLDDQGRLVGVNGSEGRAQRIRIRLKTQLGEWFLNTGVGVDWLGNVLVRNPDLRAIRAEISLVIRSVPEVIQINSLELDNDDATRQLTVTFSVLTTEGPITDEVTVT